MDIYLSNFYIFFMFLAFLLSYSALGETAFHLICIQLHEKMTNKEVMNLESHYFAKV